MDALSDEMMVERLKESFDPKLFATLTERYKKKIVQRCQSMVKDEDAAQDLTQEVFIKVFLKLDSYRQESKFSVWLDAIVHNTCLDYLRKSKKNYHEKITEKLADSVEDLSEGETELSQELSLQILEELLVQIPPEDKMILLLKYHEKIPIKGIQTALNLGESAVKMRLKRARERVNKLYQKLKP